jgi:hypothetical protein
MSAPLSRKNLPENPTADDILNAFLDYLTATDTEPYGHQEEAILELFAGNNVILNTPTGSGKSLVALALQFKSLCQGRLDQTALFFIFISAFQISEFQLLPKLPLSRARPGKRRHDHRRRHRQPHGSGA